MNGLSIFGTSSIEHQMPTTKIRNNTKKGIEKSNHQNAPSKKQQQGNLTQFKEERCPQATSTVPMTMGEGNKMTMGAVGSRKRKPARESLQYVQHGANEKEKTMDPMATFLEKNQQQMVSNIDSGKRYY